MFTAFLAITGTVIVAQFGVMFYLSPLTIIPKSGVQVNHTLTFQTAGCIIKQ